MVKTITITHEIHLTPNSPTRVKTIREAAKVKTIHSPVTTVRSRQVLAAPAQVNALTSVRTITVPRTLTATTTEVSTVVSVTTVTETTKKPHRTHP